jgi:hypothetical protein
MDNINLYAGSGGDTLAADDIGGAKYQRIKLIHGADGTNAGDVAIGNPLPIRVATDTVFGEVSIAQVSPLFQADFVYGINTRKFSTATTGSGTVSSSASLATVSTTAASSSSGTLSSLRPLRYRPGVGALARFTAMFTTGATNSQQEAGMGTSAEGLFFGYNGTTFGICRRRGSSDTWTAQASWNVDVMNGSGSSGMTLDPTKLNVFQIRYQYLGAGAIEFFVENPATGRMVLVHRVQFANNNTATSLLNPSLPIRWHAVNTTNATSISVSGASCMLALEGENKLTGVTWSRAHTKSAVTTETSVLAIRMATTLNGSTSQVIAKVASIGAAMSLNQNAIGIFRLTLNPTLGGTPAYTAFSGSTADNGVTITSGQSGMSYDTAGTTVTGGTRVYSTVLSNAANVNVVLADLPFTLTAGDVLVASIESTASATVGVALTLVEDV